MWTSRSTTQSWRPVHCPSWISIPLLGLPSGCARTHEAAATAAAAASGLHRPVYAKGAADTEKKETFRDALRHAHLIKCICGGAPMWGVCFCSCGLRAESAVRATKVCHVACMFCLVGWGREAKLDRTIGLHQIVQTCTEDRKFHCVSNFGKTDIQNYKTNVFLRCWVIFTICCCMSGKSVLNIQFHRFHVSSESNFI